jgi:hypothetical protein
MRRGELMRKRRIGIATLAVFMAFMVAVAVPAAAAGPTSELSYSGDDPAPDPYIDVDTQTNAAVDLAEVDSAHDVSHYDDSGNWVEDPKYVVNTTKDIDDGTGNLNPYTFIVTDVEDDSFGAFPRKGDDEDDEDTDASASEDNLASALDSSEWTVEQNSGNVTLSDTTTAPDVDAFRVNTDKGNNNTNVVTEVAYGNWSSELDSDESKRFVQLAVDVDTLDSDTQVEINITDESGDTKTVYIDSDKNYADNDVLANGTGEGYVLQTQLTDITTNGGGSWDNIESINITVKHGDFDGSFAWIDLEKKGYTNLGEERHDDGDSDDDWDDFKEHNTSVQGSLKVHDLTTFDSEFDDAVIHDLKFPAKWRAQDLQDEGEDEEWVAHTDSAEDYPGYDQVANISYRLELPALIDVSYSGTSLMLDQMHPSNRYVTFGYEEGAGDDDFADASLTDKTDSLGSVSDDVGDDIGIDGSISTDTEYVVTFHIKLTQSEYDTMYSGDTATATPDDGAAGGGGPVLPSGGGLLDMVFTLPGMIVTGVVTWFGVIKGLIPWAMGG